MKRLIASALLGLALAAAPALAADSQAKKPVAKGKNLMASDGRFHRTHTKKLSLQCDTCHGSEQKDTLFLRSGEAQGLGPVDRNTCLGCHKSPAKPAWYDAKRAK
jgi:cytochrome c553